LNQTTRPAATCVKTSPPDIFLLVHYFGKPAIAATAKEFCAKNNCWLIEDAAHVLRPVPGIGEAGDFVLYSPHKLLATYDGAVLIVRRKGPSALTDSFISSLGPVEDWASEIATVLSPRSIAYRGASAPFIWLLKRMLQKLGFSRVVKQPFFQPSTETGIQIVHHPRISGLSRRLLKANSSRLTNTSLYRKRHQRLLNFLISAHTSLQQDLNFENETGKNDKWTPYLAVFSGEENIISTQFDALSGSKHRATTWPDLPPEVYNNRQAHPVAWKLRHTRFFMPVHQTLTGSNFRHAFPDNRNNNTSVSADQIKIDWNIADRGHWHQWLCEARKSNLLQSWAYGEAKKNAEGWTVRRGVFKRGNLPVAIVQMLEKRFVFLKLSRVNRGPLFLASASSDDITAVWNCLLRTGDVLRGRVLSIAPELSFSGGNLALLARNNVFARHPRVWTSVWFDLSRDLGQIRAGLTAKWRSKLVVAEKNDLQVTIGSSNEEMQWMMERYEENMQQKDFEGISLALLKNTYRNTSADSPLFVCRAAVNGEFIAGIGIACHGAAATYLVGWSGDKGRNLKANHFLLWSIINHLKNNGILWLDLGGIDEELTPGITEFKLGMGGAVYELVGEGWRIGS
jgi:hypothetical protein